MKVVILAAGIGRSLYPLTSKRPKTLLEVGGVTLLERLLAQTVAHGLTPVVVVGHKREMVCDVLRRFSPRLGAEVVENPHYGRTNTLHSLALAAPACAGRPFAVVDGDLICDDDIVADVLRDTASATLAVDRVRVMGREEVKVVCDGDRVAAIGKDVPAGAAHGEFIGLARYSAEVGAALFDEIQRIVRDGETTAYYEEAIDRLARRHRLHALDVGGRRWVEIDFRADYVEALRRFGDLERAEAVAAEPVPRGQLLFCPGPVRVSRRVRQAMRAPDIGHREVEFSEMVNRIRLKLGKVFGVRNFHRYTTVVLTGSGSAVNEAVLGTAGVGRRVLVLANGEFGERLGTIATHLGLDTESLAGRWGQRIDLSAVERRLARGGVDLLAWVHHETSTGMLNPLPEIAALARRHGVATMVDAVSSLGGVPVDVEAHDVTFCTASANKAIGSIPGLAFVCGQRRAFEALETVRARSMYLDLYRHFTYNDRLYQTPNTPAVTLYFALEAALDELLAGGLDVRFAHHRRLARRLRRGLRQLGLRTFLPEAVMSPLLTTVELPVGFSADEFHERLKRAGFVVYPGKGILRDRAFQVANMGALGVRHVDRFLQALESVVAVAPAPQTAAAS